MYPSSTKFNASAFSREDLLSVARAVLVIGGVSYDITRFVSEFGSVSRSMEYDTGKFSPGSHSLKIENTREFGDFLFSLRHYINETESLGFGYWPDLTYKIYFGFRDPIGMNAGSNNGEELICVYEGVIHDKEEDRMNETVYVRSTDILKLLQDRKLARQDLILDNVFTNFAGETDETAIQQLIRYGQHLLDDTYTGEAVDCTAQGLGSGVIDINLASAIDPIEKVGQEVNLSSTTDYNGHWVIKQVLSNTHFRLWSNTSAVSSQAGKIIFRIETKQRTNFDKPGGCVLGIPNSYFASQVGAPSGTKYTVSHSYPKAGFPGSTYLFMPTSPGKFGPSETFLVTDTVDYNGFDSNSAFSSGISAYTSILSGTAVNITLGTALPFGTAGVALDITITNSALGYNGRHTAYVTDSTHADIYDIGFLGTEAISFAKVANLMTVNHAYISDETGFVYFEATNSTLQVPGFQYYFPLQNYRNDPTEMFVGSVVSLMYWDYIAGLWCRFDSTNFSGVFQCWDLFTQTGANGLYYRLRWDRGIHNDQNIKFDLGAVGWQQYLNGTGTYFNSKEPKPALAIEFNGMIAEANLSVPVWVDLASNPVAVIYDILTSPQMAAIPKTYTDKKHFYSPDAGYTFDVSAQYFYNAGVPSTGGRIKVEVNSEISVLDLLQKIMLPSGIMMVCSHIQPTTDRRIKLKVNRPYDPSSDYPPAQERYSMNSELKSFKIRTASEKTTDLILMNSFITHTANIPDAILLVQKGSGSRSLSLSGENEPVSIWQDSGFWADLIATNYYNKLSTAWEDVDIDLDMRGIIVEGSDYISAYDHKLDEEIVIEVYSWDFDFDNDSCRITGKKVWSSKEPG